MQTASDIAIYENITLGQAELSALTKATEIKLTKCVLPPQSYQKLVSHLHPSVKSIQITGSSVTDALLTQFRKQRATTIQSVNLDDNLVTDTGCDQIYLLSKCRRVSLKNNKVKEYGFKALLKLPEIQDIDCPCPDITRFQINSSYVEDKTINLILKNLKNITNVSLSANKFSMVGLNSVIEKTPAINILDLSNNNIGPDGAAIIAKNRGLQILMLRTGYRMKVQEFSQGTLKFSNHFMSVAINLLLSQHITQFKDALCWEFYSFKNHIGSEGALLLANLEKLIWLKIEQNDIDNDMVFLEIARRRPTLRGYFIAQNNVSNATKKTLAKWLPTTTMS